MRARSTSSALASRTASTWSSCFIPASGRIWRGWCWRGRVRKFQDVQPGHGARPVEHPSVANVPGAATSTGVSLSNLMRTNGEHEGSTRCREDPAAFDLWIKRVLKERYGSAAREPVPDD